jgi:hypothetical protein
MTRLPFLCVLSALAEENAECRYVRKCWDKMKASGEIK